MEVGREKKTFSIGEVAEQTGVSRRTVRYYVQRNLIDPPEGRGRGSVYTPKHLEQIARVVRLQREGMALDDIPDAAAHAPRISPHGQPALVMRVPIAAGLRLEIDAGLSVPSPDTLDEVASACERILRRAKK